jgi:hypothetical protein
MKLFNGERKYGTYFSSMYTSISDKIQQEIISNLGDAFDLYHIVLIDMLDFKNSLWWFINIFECGCDGNS